jgi:hypothetical protein
MDEIKLSQSEEYEYQAVKRFADGHKNIRRLCAELSCSDRTVRRYAAGYRNGGRAYFAHGNKRKTSPRRTSDEIRNTIAKLYAGKYAGATYAHFAELLAANENIRLSKAFIRKLLRARFLLSPKATKKTKRDVRRELRRLQETAPSEERNELAARILALDEAHPTRPRKKYFGELLQTDASEHLWFGEEKSALHIAVDDATSRIVGAYFDTHETLYGYFRMSEQILTVCGIPVAFLADNRTVFMSNAKADASGDRKTQFGYMCKNLGIEIKTTSIAQAKGRVERMWETLQNRLPIELRLAGIKTIDEANIFLLDYIPRFNEKFGLPVQPDKNVFIPAPPPDEIRLLLSVVAERQIDGGSSLRYECKPYAVIDGNGDRVLFAKGTKDAVAKTLDGALFFTVCDTTYALELIPEHEQFSKNFDDTPPMSPTLPPTSPPSAPAKVVKIPLKNHPWRLHFFRKFADKIKNA